ncbi:unnamed protein product [Oikopleura dioica]|uniref:Uncharacterized protein n=1 Tax=Oikopleura dioica TaxID=34765 RepID=E4WYE1_OIKDI|nr:unnamed protein product [Oikopleura dioica]CBY33892.1 unnamed protein product [Oikopleura dioica]
MNIQDDGVIRIIFGNIRKFTDLFYRTVKTNSRKNLAGLALFLVKLETACKRLKVAPPTCYSLSGSTIMAAIKEMQDPVFAISILEKTVLRHVSSSNLIKIDEKRKFNKNQEEELVKVLLKINHVKENETLSKMINHFMRHWGLQRDEKRQEKHKRKKEQVDGHYRKR